MESAPPRKVRSMRDTFINMLGEFVALNKSPDFKLSSKSSQFLADAIREEIRHERQKKLNDDLFNQSYPQLKEPRHVRTCSTNSAYRNSPVANTFTLDPNGSPRFKSGGASTVDRRQSLPVIGGENIPPTVQQRFFQRVRLLSNRGSYKVAEKDRPVNISNKDAKGKGKETPLNAPAKAKSQHEGKVRDASLKRIPKSSDSTAPERRTKESSRRRRASATTATETSSRTTNESAEQKKATRARKQKISVAAMIADVSDGKTSDNIKTPKHKCSK